MHPYLFCPIIIRHVGTLHESSFPAWTTIGCLFTTVITQFVCFLPVWCCTVKWPPNTPSTPKRERFGSSRRPEKRSTDPSPRRVNKRNWYWRMTDEHHSLVNELDGNEKERYAVETWCYVCVEGPRGRILLVTDQQKSIGVYWVSHRCMLLSNLSIIL